MSLHEPRWRTPLASSTAPSLRPGTTSPRFVPAPFRSNFMENLRDCFRPGPPRLRSGAPATFSRRQQKTSATLWRSQAVSLAIYSCGIVLFLATTSRPHDATVQAPASVMTLLAPDVSAHERNLPPGLNAPRGGGGGGTHSPLPVTKGSPPKFTLVQLAPPSRPRNNPSSLLADASLLGDPALQFSVANLNGYGDPLAGLVNDSNGHGRGGGMGDGYGTGDGPGSGPGLGKGNNGGWGGDVFQPGHNGVGVPTCAYCPDAKYSEDARRAKFQGVVILQVVVTPDGRATQIEVLNSPGLGLDREAVVAVDNWRFKPALGPNREPVATRITIEVQFRLL